MNKAVYYTAAGVLATIALLSLVKKKTPGTSSASIISTSPARALPGPTSYTPAMGDLLTVVAARFGINQTAIKNANGVGQGTWTLMPTQTIKLPPGGADLGARKFAMGTAR